MKTKMTNADYLELSSDIATSFVEQLTYGDPCDLWTEDKDGVRIIDPIYQPMFEDALDTVQHHLLSKITITD